jgi:hypothetical protein
MTTCTEGTKVSGTGSTESKELKRKMLEVNIEVSNRAIQKAKLLIMMHKRVIQEYQQKLSELDS